MEPLALDDKLNFQLLDENIQEISPNLSQLESPIHRHVGGGMDSGYIHKGMTLKEQERIIDDLRKENYNLKMRIYFLEDTMNKMSPSYVNEALKENVDLKSKLEKSYAERKLLYDQVSTLQSKLSPSSLSPSISETLEVKLKRQIDHLTNQNETLELQLMETRNEKLNLEASESNVRESQRTVQHQLELSLKQIQTLKSELELSQTQTHRYQQELIETQVQLQSFQQRGTKSNSSTSPSEKNAPVHNELNQDTSSSNYLEQMKHLKSHIQAQTLLLQEREKQVKELQNQITILTNEVQSQHVLDLFQPPSSTQDGNGPMSDQRSTALYIQLTELHRQVKERVQETTRLQTELNLQKEIHSKTVRDVKNQFQLDHQQLQGQLQQLQTLYQNLQDQHSLLQKQKEQLETSYQTKTQSLQELQTKWDTETQIRDRQSKQYQQDLIQLQNELIVKEKAIFQLQNELASRVHQEQTMVHQMDHLQQQCKKVDATTTDTHSQINALQEELRKTQLKCKQVEKAWQLEMEQRCQVEQKELTKVAELDDLVRTERIVNQSLQTQVKELQKDLEMIKERHEKEMNEVQELARIGNQVDRLSQLNQYETKLTKLETEKKENQILLQTLQSSLKSKSVELQTCKDRLTQVQANAEEQYQRLTKIIAQQQQQQQQQNNVFSSDSIQRVSPDPSASEPPFELGFTSNDTRHSPSLTKIRSGTTITISYNTLYQIFVQLSMVLGKNTASISFPPLSSNLESQILNFLHELVQLKTYFESRCKSIESHWAQEFRLFLKKLEHKTLQIQKYDEAIRTATSRVRQWKTILNQHHLEALTTETEKLRLQRKLNDSLEEEEQAWKVKLKEMEKKLKETEFRANADKLGAKEKVQELVQSIRELERQLEVSKRLNQQYKDIMEQQKHRLESTVQSLNNLRYEELKQTHKKAERSLRRKETLLKNILSRLERLPRPNPELLSIADELRRNLDPLNEDLFTENRTPDSNPRPGSTLSSASSFSQTSRFSERDRRFSGNE